MLKVLIHKQILESFSFLFYDNHKGVPRSKSSKIGFGFLFAFVFLTLALAIGVYAGLMVSTFQGLGINWFYYCIMSLVSIILGVFGSVFSTYASLYLPKDNELMLSLPIHKKDLILSRLVGVYVMGFVYMAIAFLPSMVIGQIGFGFTISSLICQILLMVALSFIVLALSTLLGWVVAQISVRLKNKSIIVVFLSLGFIGIYYYFYFKIVSGFQDLILKAMTLAVSFKDKGYILYVLGKAGDGDYISTGIIFILSVVSVIIVYALVYMRFDRLLMTNKGQKKKEYNAKSIKQTNVSTALLKKEWLRFFSSPTYMLNSGIGSVFTILLIIVCIFQKEMILDMLVFLSDSSLLLIIAMTIIGFVATSNMISAPSVSLEGKNMWILQTLPVKQIDILQAKFNLHFLFTIIPLFVLDIVLIWLLKFSILETIFIFLYSILIVVFSDLDGLFLGLKFPNMEWTNETAVIKQGMAPFVALFGNWIVVFAIAGIYYFVHKFISVYIYAILILVLLSIISLILVVWIYKKGVQILEHL
ncbi:hypothetical protein [Floccifex sp.]|uniref:hypothetical protein n=1 Tax=Floccifex sp. TaxID=2815810 RepID=UPI003EFE7A5F